MAGTQSPSVIGSPSPEHRRWRSHLLCSLLLLLCAAPLLAATPEVRVLIDVSGSMRQTDPENLRRPALRLLTELLPNGARAGVWLFADGTDPLVPPDQVDAKWKTKARGLIERIHSRGSFTDIERAITTVTAGWDTPDASSERSLILLTDGLVDVAKDGDKSAASRVRILSEQIARLQSAKIKVHTVGLSDKVDTELLRQLSTQTGGWMEVVKDASALQRTFLHMLEQSAAPTTVPLQGNHFDIDDQVSEFTLLAFHAPSGHTTLVSPAGEEYSAAAHPSAVAWRAEGDYDLVTLTTPKAGRWTLQGVTDPDNRVVVVTDLGMELGGLPNSLAAGSGAHLEAWLTTHGQPISRRDFLQLATAQGSLTQLDAGDQVAQQTPDAAATRESAGHTAPAEATGAVHEPAHSPAATQETHAEQPAAANQEEGQHEEGQREEGQQEKATVAPERATPGRFQLPLDTGSGRFRAELETRSLGVGSYQVQVTIDGGTFKRQSTRRLKIAGPPLDIRYTAQLPTEQTPSAMLVVTFTAEPDLIDPKTLGGYLLIQGPSGQNSAIDIPAFAKTSLVARQPITTPGNYSIHGRLMARSPSGEPIVFEAPRGELSFVFEAPDASHDEPATGDANHLSWLALSAYLAGGNLALGGLLGLTWWLLRRPVRQPAEKTGKRKSA